MKSARRALMLGVIIAAMSLPARAEIIADQSLIRLTAAEIPVLDLLECQIIKGNHPVTRSLN